MTFTIAPRAGDALSNGCTPAVLFLVTTLSRSTWFETNFIAKDFHLSKPTSLVSAPKALICSCFQTTCATNAESSSSLTLFDWTRRNFDRSRCSIDANNCEYMRPPGLPRCRGGNVTLSSRLLSMREYMLSISLLRFSSISFADFELCLVATAAASASA